MEMTLRMGAAHHDIRIVEATGTTVLDLSKMSRSDRHKTRRIVVGALTNSGVLNDRGGKFAMGKGTGKKANSKRRRSRTNGKA